MIFRVAPGRSGHIGTVQDDRGEVHVDPARMADTLRKHWARVFEAKGIDKGLLQRWLDDDLASRPQPAAAPAETEAQTRAVRHPER